MKYRFKTKPYHHQVAALKKLLSTKFGGALLMEPRTGKTKVCVDYMSILHSAGKVNRVLVVCPLGVIGVWRDEIRLHSPHRRRIVIWDSDGRKEVALPKHGKDILDIVIINYDAFATPGKKTKKGRRSRRGGRFKVTSDLTKWNPQLIILDESHRIKNASAKKSRMIHKLGTVAEYRVIATGTSVTKKKRIFDIYSQWKFLNPQNPLVSGRTLGEFKDYFSRWINRNGFPQWLNNRNQSELRKYLHQDSFAITRDECFDLPDSRWQIIPVELSSSAAVYDEMAEEMIANIQSGEIVEASIKLVQSLRLSQITSGLAKTTPSPDHPESKLVRVGTEKIDVLKSILEDLFEAEEKVVIGARFIADIHAIEKVCEQLKVPYYSIHGAIPVRDRDKARQAFAQRNGPIAWIAQPAASSEGIDLSTASILIWFSLTTSWVHFTQFNDRIALSPRKKMYMYLQATGTVDELLYEGLIEDGNVAKAITDSPERLSRNFKIKRDS